MKNFYGLSRVLCPVDASVGSVLVNYQSSMVYSDSFGGDRQATFNSQLAELKNKYKDGGKFNPKYFSVSLSLNIGKGLTIWISGLKGDYSFKIGQKIKRGEVIGAVAYA